MRITAHIALLLAVLLSFAGCKTGAGANPEASQQLPDTLRVGTLYSPTSYFLFRDEPMGFDYDLAKRFAEEHNMHFEIVTAPNLNSLVAMLDSGYVDLLAYPIPQTSEYRDQVLHCGPEEITSQFLVQRKGDDMITDVVQLVGRTVSVEEDSKYQYRLENLNDELGGGLQIQALRRDTLITEDFLDMERHGEIEYTVVDSEIADLNKPYYPDLDFSVKISLDQKGSWAVAPGDSLLAKTIDLWAGEAETDKAVKQMHRRYFEQEKGLIEEAEPEPLSGAKMLGKNKISHFDQSFRNHAKTLGWDWRLLAAVGYTESHFNPKIRSWAGARGIMQLMPRTAAAHGLKGDAVEDPDANIRVGAKVLASLDQSLQSYVKDPTERRKFVLASYNSGLGHILDAIALAKKYGKNPAVWDGNVREAVLMKSNQKYYNDPVVKHGYFRGRETVEFVDKVLNLFQAYQNQIHS